MRKYLGTFVAVVLALASIVGLYLAFAVISLEWIFWLVIVVAALLALIWVARPTVISTVRSWRDYPAQLQRVAALEQSNTKLRSQRDEARALAMKASEEGLAEGRAQVRGAVLAGMATTPQIVGIAERESAVNLVAKQNDSRVAQIGARYRVIVELTGQVRGVVQLTEIDQQRGICYLTCVEATSAEFWEVLSSRVISDNSPPPGVVLQPFVLAAIRASDPVVAALSDTIQQEEENDQSND